MIHGRNRAAVIDQVEFIVQQCGLQGIRHEILFSKRCFKQRGANYRGDLPSVQAGRVANE
jgi:hypothetical protein